MTSYQNRLYRKGTAEFGVYAAYDGASITVEISCHNLNFKSFWGGEWLSSWYVDLAAGTVAGRIVVHNHYFENGNIQFNMNKDIPATKLKQLAARQIVDFISNQETNVTDPLPDDPVVPRRLRRHVHGDLRETTEGDAEDHAGDPAEIGRAHV